jgi:septal ring factor EnvC (AmiA/AmiB activator)
MWLRIGNFLWSIVRFLAPERAAYEVIIARYRSTLEEERATFDAREKEFREEITSRKGAETRCQRMLSEARHDITVLQRQIWELTAVVGAIDAVKRMREDPEFQRHTVEQVQLLMRRNGDGPDEAPDANPHG